MAVAVFALLACGGGTTGSSAARPPKPTDIAAKAGCTGWAADTRQLEMYVKESGTCTVDGQPLNVNTFNDATLTAARTYSAAPAQGRRTTGVLGTKRIDLSTQAIRYSGFPTTTRCPDGRLLMVWREATDHTITRDGVIMGAYSSDNGVTWGAKIAVLGDGGVTDYRDPGISALADGRMALTYYTGTIAQNHMGALVRFSSDNGATWGVAVRIDPNLFYAASSAPLVQLADGTLIATWYGETTGDSSAFVSRSTDGGATWGARIKIADGPAASVQYVEPWTVLGLDGTLYTFIRTAMTSISMVKSTDGGLTWTAPAIAFAGNGRPSAVITRNGTIMVAPRTVDNYHGMILTSIDNGVTWSAAQTIQITSARVGGWLYAGPFEVAPNVVWVPSCVELSSTSTVLRGFYFLTSTGVSPAG